MAKKQEKKRITITLYPSPELKKKITELRGKRRWSENTLGIYILEEWFKSQDGCTPHVSAEKEVSQTV